MPGRVPMRRAKLLVGCGLSLLAGCARPEPPVVGAVADTVTLRETPVWLPAGWVEDPLPSALPLENTLTRRWSPQDATAPFLMVSRYSVAQAEALAVRAGDEPLLDWLVAKTRTAIAGPGTKVGEDRRWRREGLRLGRRIDLVGVWPEGDAGLVSGAVGVGQSFSGAVVLATALAPCRADGSLDEEAQALVDLLLASVPVEQGLPVTVPDQPAEPATP